MTYPRKLKTITFEVDGNSVTISDTEDNMAATAAYNEYLRGGFIKCHPESVPEGADIVVNANLITGMMVAETTVGMDKGDDDFCNVECDCGGGDDGKQGIKSVTISPAIQTTPSLNSFFPIYWEDLTKEQKDNGVIINLETDGELSGEYAVTITPTAEWYAFADGTPTKGAAVTKPMLTRDGYATVSANVAASPDDESEDERYFSVKITITTGK